MKKANRKLIPAVAMLLVSAIMLSTASVAWFSMNTKASATNMSVTAQTSTNLLITKTRSDATDYAATVDMALAVDTLVPCSTIGGDTASPAFFKVKNAGNTMTQGDYSSKSDTTFETATEETDYAKTTVWLKSVGTDVTNLIATINVTGGGSAKLDPSLRMMLVANNKTYIYLPVGGGQYGSLDDNKAVKAIGGGTNAEKELDVIKTKATSADTVILTEMTKDTPVQVDIYIWYEGEDPKCNAVNAQDLAATVMSIDFSVTAKQG